MKNSSIKILTITLLFMVWTNLSIAQVAINQDNSNPDASAILDVKSTDKGILIPRMSTTQRTTISFPAKGLLVFDNDTDSFWFYDGNNWLSLSSTATAFEYDNANKIVKPNAANSNVANDDFVFGSPQLDDAGNLIYDSRFFFDKSKAAFRAGLVAGTQWDDANIGFFSAAFGRDAIASNLGSFAFGGTVTASGEESFAGGSETTAIGNYSVALGKRNTSPSYGEITLGLFATNYTPAGATPYQSYNTNDRLFTIGNGTGVNTRSDAFMILKNGNTFINGALTIDNNYTFPTTDGSNGQALITDGSGALSWTTLTDNDNQDLTLSGNSLSLTNDGTPVDLGGFLDNTDNQDLTLSGNNLSLTNDASPVDLSGYLDNTDNQSLSLSGSSLTISGGNTISLSSINTNTNIYNTNGNIASNERRLTFSNTGATQYLTLKRSLNTDGLGLAFQNSGTFYTSFILVPSDGNGNDGGLDFRTKNDIGTLGSVENTMRLTDNGTVTLPEYGQGNVTGTAAKILAVESDGDVVEIDASELTNNRIAYTFDETASTTDASSKSGWWTVSDKTNGMSTNSGDIVTVRITFSAEIQGGSGSDVLKFRVLADGIGCSDITGGTTSDLEVYRNVRDHSVQTSIQYTFPVSCNGTYQFALQANFDGTDDDVVIDQVQVTAVKY